MDAPARIGCIARRRFASAKLYMAATEGRNCEWLVSGRQEDLSLHRNIGFLGIGIVML